MLRDYLLDQYPDNVSLVHGREADDQLAIDQYDDYYKTWGAAPEDISYSGLSTIICTIDKDLKMIPGLHYNWNTDEKLFVTEIEGLRWFYTQCLTGDMTDNIKGLHGVGAKSALVSKLDAMEDELTMFEHVYEQYEKRFGSYAEQFLIENGTLLWMMRDEADQWADTFKGLFKQMLINKQEEKEDDFNF